MDARPPNDPEPFLAKGDIARRNDLWLRIMDLGRFHTIAELATFLNRPERTVARAIRSARQRLSNPAVAIDVVGPGTDRSVALTPAEVADLQATYGSAQFDRPEVRSFLNRPEVAENRATQPEKP